MAPSLPALPEELISTIAACAPTQTLLNLVRVNRQLNRIATTYLYRRISLTESNNNQANYNRLYSLVIHLLQNSQHASYVEHLRVRSQRSEIMCITRFEDLHPLLKDKLDLLTGREARHSTVDVGWDRPDVLIWILLTLVPNLCTLDGYVTTGYQRFLPHWQSRDLLSNLRALAIVADGTGREPFHRSVPFEFPELQELDSMFVYKFKQAQSSAPGEIFGLFPEEQEYMRYVADMIDAIFGPHQSVATWYDHTCLTRHLEITDACVDTRGLAELVHAFSALRTFAIDLEKDFALHHPCFYSAVIAILSQRAETLTALSIGTPGQTFWGPVPPIDFSPLKQLQHLRIPALLFLADTSHSQSLPDDLMRKRFPATLRRLVLKVFKKEEHHILSSLRHYIAAEPPIIPSLRELHIHCHSPEVMHAWLHDVAAKNNIRLRVFRKLQVSRDDLCITPFVDTVEKLEHMFGRIPIKRQAPIPTLLIEDLSPIEEYVPEAEAIVPIIEEARVYRAQAAR